MYVLQSLCEGGLPHDGVYGAGRHDEEVVRSEFDYLCGFGVGDASPVVDGSYEEITSSRRTALFE